ncbi:stage III sporulation protein AF [Clostridium cochlearium]|uniref:Stage III sporulation protein AF n=1 Tax=Clostridium cochlearium TaxID=1494 RepID=A0A240A8Y6_CLOCO|nr:stage III sporulation protein AF [Clostridium cochlearium]MBV1816972.1 stage III sporulation protein AF [Bacteroidales bacterium MSK.15.36]NSJ90772.1 stage III sporulation protein AF [Coprococcus sp. MSK.21.13]MBE6065349.1 stage III sporulation protein AF [Clostridium cochlearium]MBU5268989.1 stage III sporulation protein AF [Clostridium cochlearium]MCG4570724.1 stage III sporulation protein AF [Clostridium cochlearium]
MFLKELRHWIINIATVVLFITAVEMLLPNNNLKKYSKFVMGLILMVTLINPLIKLVDKDFNINRYYNEFSKGINNEESKESFFQYKKKNIEMTKENFNKNLQQLVDEKLKNKFPKGKFKVDTKIQFDEKDNNFIIENIKVDFKDKRVRKIKKVQVSTKENENVSEEDELSRDIKNYLSEELGLSKDIILVNKM